MPLARDLTTPWCIHCGKLPFRDDNLSDLRELIELSERNPKGYDFQYEKDDYRLHQVSKWAIHFLRSAVMEHTKNDEEADYLMATIAKDVIDTMQMDLRTQMYKRRLLDQSNQSFVVAK